MNQAISDREWKENEIRCEEAFQKINRNYRRGMMTKEERDRLFQRTLWESFREFMSNKGLSFRPGNWERLREDYERLHKGSLPDSKEGKPWLVQKGKDEAPVPDKIQCLKMMDFLGIPLELYKPLPASSPHPDCYPGHFYNETILGMKIWESSGGLSDDPDPAGKGFVFQDHFGLKTHVTILRKVPPADRKYQGEPDYIGRGTVEGYTSDQPRDIEIFLKEGQLVCLKWWEEEGDRDAFIAFPLWRDYVRLQDEKEAIRSRVLEELVKRY